MQNNFPKIPFLISALSFCVVLFLCIFFYGKVNNNYEESQLKEIEWQTETDRREEIKTLNNSVKIIETEKAQLETHFAKSSDIVPFLDTIEALAPRSGIKAEVVSVNIPLDNAGLLVGMKASGDFKGIYKFLTLLENSPYELEFLSMDIQKATSLGEGVKNVPPAEWNALFKIKLLSFIK